MITVVETAPDWEAFRALVVEYAHWLGVDLCFQGFDDELAALPRHYGAPHGVALLAWAGNEPVGSVGVRRFEAGVCELKRMYIREAARGTGLGRALAERAITEARRMGYGSMRLDTLATMAPAIALYTSLGFTEIGAYRENPLDEPCFFELTL